MDQILREALDTNVFKEFGHGGGGCISSGQGYVTDHGTVFVKRNGKSGARKMFDGEFASLQAMLDTSTIRVPKPIKVLDSPEGGAVLVMEHLDIQGLGRQSAALGTRLASLHLHNSKLQKTAASSSVHEKADSSHVSYVDQFGFDVPTCCGYIAQDNTWCDDWLQFYATQKLQQQIGMIEKKHGDRELSELWSELQLKLPTFFNPLAGPIRPALLHGDMWGGNVGSVDGEPVLFDPASFYGHSEFELGIAGMFGGFDRHFYTAYHQLIPRQPGFAERNTLYELFHYLNHWNHFGGGYRSSSINHMKSLLKV